MEVVGRIFEREQDGSIGDGIAGARISFSVGSQGNGTTTGPGGRYSIDLPPGTYAIRAEAQGFSAATTRLVLRESTRPQVLNLFLSRGGAHDDDQPDGVHGRIFERNTDGSIGEPIEGVSVLASRRLGRTTRAVSDADGRFRLKLSPGRYLLSARHEKFRNVRSRIVVQDGFVVRNLFMVRDQPDMMNPPDICDHAPGRSGPVRTSLVMVPGSDQPVRLTYEIIDGLAIVDGGVILGDAGEIEAESEALANGVLPPNPEDPVPDVASGVGIVTQPLLALSARGRLWDGAVVPFAMRNINPTLRRRIEDAMDHISNNSSIEFVPAADDFVDRVIFAFSDDAGGIEFTSWSHRWRSDDTSQ